jgi:rhamnogalacturonan endolyase
MKHFTVILLLTTAITVYAQPAYDISRLQREKLGRGLIAIRQSSQTVCVSWRYLSSDSTNTGFHVYRNEQRLTNTPVMKTTCYYDKYAGNGPIEYRVEPVSPQGKTLSPDGKYTLASNAPVGYLNIPLNKPERGITPAGQEYTYLPNDASIGDADGDGEYEIILKWDPSNSHDNAHDGYAGNTYIDCYTLAGQKLWRIDLGKNIRSGAHYTPFIVYDLDGDGITEIVMKTADGTVDGQGNVIGDANADYRDKGDPAKQRGGDFPSGDPRGKASESYPPRNQGRILTGPEYLTVFNGKTGKAMQTVNYIPPRGNLMKWGDDRANRADRFLAAVAYLDGVRPSVVMCRGYYTRTVLAAWDWDGKELKHKWVFDTNNHGFEACAGQGNHNLRVADVDGDGCDEIVYGSMTVNNDGKCLYSTGLGHGDALHLTVIDPTRPGLQVWACHENKKDGSTYRDASTGDIILQIPSKTDVGRCLTADIDPTYKGLEMWSSASKGIRNIKGEIINTDMNTFSINMAVWWDGDLLRELLDKNRISKYNREKKVCEPLTVFEGALSNNGTKATPCLQGDIVGDWREEVLLRTEDNAALRLYVSVIPTKYRFHTFLEDPVYRISIATQNVGYNQPTQPGFYFGAGLEGEFRGTVIHINE